MSLALKPRRRGVVIFYAILATGVLTLVGVPLFGLVHIDRATDRSHDYTTITSSVEELTTGLLQLITGPLAQYGATRDPLVRVRAQDAITEARAQLAAIESQQETYASLGLSEAVETQLADVREFLAPSEQYLADVEQGVPPQESTAAAQILQAASRILEGRSTFTDQTREVEAQLDRDRREAVRDAAYLLTAAVAFFIVLVTLLGTLNRLRIQRLFAAEASRRESAERLAAHRADVVNMASHELRNPLTALTMSSELLVREAGSAEPEQLRELAHDAHIAALRCNTLVNELLDLGRLDADRLELRTGATPLRKVLDEAIAMSEAHHGPRIIQLSGEPEIAVHADPDRLRVILRNLIDNAFKYSPAGSAVFVHVEEEQGTVRIDIRDEGDGVPEEFRDRIFQRFERLHGAGHAGGVGIGLFLSRELARRMDGDIRYRARDRGSEFELLLPAAA